MEKLWCKHRPQFVYQHDSPGFSVDAGAFGLVRFTPRTLGQIWLLGFASWRALEAYCPYVYLGYPIVLDQISMVPDQVQADRRLTEALAKAEELRLIEDVEQFGWPQGIIDPGSSPNTLQDRAVVDLVKIATAFIFLHEIRHLMFQDAGDSPASPLDEEMECDRFGKTFLLQDIPEYCATSSEPELAVRNKRSLGLVLGCFVLLRITKDFRGSETHPPVSQRVRELVGTNEISATKSLLYACCLLLGTMHHEKRLPPKLEFPDPSNLFESLVSLATVTPP